MEWPIAAAAVVLAVILSFPLAHLYELGGETIWPPAVLHFVVQGAAKIFIISGDAVVPFPIAWMAASMAVSMLVFLARRPLPPL
jgi:hypothetical protein